jgi:hypothetical protein
LTGQLLDRTIREEVLISKVLDVMGEPDSLGDGCYTFFSKDKGKQTGFLYIETDPARKSDGLEAGYYFLKFWSGTILALVREFPTRPRC